ncbi:hypothetical protein IMG5_176210 [Ichthyophthirius multifiliis]|uniref:cAMP-dependent protein kinase regulatory subunit n=1 Tax=Ichthyophthirius multifiliis TaxID=5932 RepID=G0R2A1_ICHMU|nr:hypothetical protein IMG5_176210 [Ichthyophthirius multifiliis]EGR28404.1 hypothetical protein IMG5_176210 [Ichthyophthirius multifiliis]|eukprot:XP_004027994.1 hypothetical protein IMG5_176210 [Ichthyophthirius multifiliis]
MYDSLHDKQINPLFEKLILELLKVQPENFIDFSINWLKQNGQSFTHSHQNSHHNEKNHDHNHAHHKKQHAGVHSDSEDEDDEVNDFDQQEFQMKLLSKQTYVPKVIPKDQDQKERIEKRLMQAFMFSSLDEREREIVVNAMQEVKFAQGDWIIKQGEDGEVLYVIDQGELDCFKRFTKDGENKYLKTYQPGEAFGELALLYNAPRAASIQAKTQSILFSLDRECFNNIVKDSAIKKRERFEQTLKNVELLDSMDPYERIHLCDGMKDIKIQKRRICYQRKRGTNFYMIEEGELIATKKDQNGDQKTVYEYKEGDYFGELALVKNIPRQANVIAVTDVNLVYLDFDTFKRLMGPIENILKRNEEKYAKYNQENLDNLDNQI